MKPGRRRVVLVGGGHAHLLTLKNADQFVRAGAAVTLIGPDRYHYYSGMGPGMLSRIYEPRQARFDVQRMIEDRGGAFLRGAVESVDEKNRRLILSDGRTVDFDLASFNVGSYVPADTVPGAETEAIPVKPIENLEKAREAILATPPRAHCRVLVIGAGPAGVELAGNVWRLGQREGVSLEILLVGAEERILPKAPRRASVLAERSLIRRGIRVSTGRKIAALAGGVATDQLGEAHRYDVALLTTGIRPKPLSFGSGIETAPDGALLVDDRLQSVSDPHVFGGGDCIAFRGGSLEKVGVYAVREAPVLLHNLLARLQGEPLRAFRPQRRYLLIFNLGDGTGLLVWGRWAWRARGAFAFKNYLDTRFMRMFQVSGETA